MSQSYKRLCQIGTGSYGQAWLVCEHGTANKYVSKVIRVARLTEKETDQCVTEVMVLARCNHRNIIRYVEAFVSHGALNIVMEYADGGDIHKRIQKQNGIYFSPDTVLDWFIQIVLALDYIHSRNILHRDLKSQNVFLTSAGVVKLGDFGIARILQQHEAHALTTIGTPFYISPEICQKKPYNAKTDMWAAGCLLYEMCLLHVPFNAPDFSSLVVHILQCQYDPVPRYFGPAVQHLVMNLLVVDPSKRLSAKEVLALRLVQPFVEAHIPRSARQHKGQRSRSLATVSNVENEKPENDRLNLVCSSQQRGHRPRSLVRNVDKNNRKELLQNGIQRSYSHHNICSMNVVRSNSSDSRSVPSIEAVTRNPEPVNPTRRENIEDRMQRKRASLYDENSSPAPRDGACASRCKNAETPEMAQEINVKRTYTVANPVFRRFSEASPYLSETVGRQRESLTDDKEREKPVDSPKASLVSGGHRDLPLVISGGHRDLPLVKTSYSDLTKDSGEDEVFEQPTASAAMIKDKLPDRCCDTGTAVGELSSIKQTVEQPRRQSKVDSRTYIIKRSLVSSSNNNYGINSNNCSNANNKNPTDVVEAQFLAASVVKHNPKQARQILLDAITMETSKEKADEMVAMVTRTLDNGQSYQEICDVLGKHNVKYLPLILACYTLSAL